MTVEHVTSGTQHLSANGATRHRILEAQAEGRLRLNRYEHGGGRLWIEGKDGGRELVCDLYREDTRELILMLLGVTL